MTRTVEIEELQKLIALGAQVLEVLPEEEYESEHIAGAINLPLQDMTAGALARLDRNRPVVTYCHDRQ
jgi:rhodanese-related sulfurtransferase